ncbi:hypothetical protein niasHT_018541 [Heterodera trifolii]|uniref:Uncharacterized protein n=1 Tax=Heterodera trifolii TaxID=157864 RepID=A0ABD2L3U6_9BILA
MQVPFSNAYPGECIGEFLHLFYMSLLFPYAPYDGAQNVILDHLYLHYFNVSDEFFSEKSALRISIYTHFYMLRWKMAQNREKLNGLIVAGSDKSIYAEIYFNLQRAKYELFKALNGAEFEWEKPSCAFEELAKETVEDNFEEIAEWMLSDLMVSLDKRKRLIKYLNALSAENDHEKIEKARTNLIKLFGFARASLLCTFKSEFGILLEEVEIVQMARNQLRTQFMYKLGNYWIYYATNFWHGEKTEMIIEAEEDKRAHILGFSASPASGQQLKMLFWENGPIDVSLFRALKICTTEAADGYNRKFDGTKLAQIEQLELTQFAKLILCMGKHLRNSPKKDEVVAKLHFEKVAELLEEANGDEFWQMLSKNKKKLQHFLDNDEKAEQLLRKVFKFK